MEAGTPKNLKSEDICLISDHGKLNNGRVIKLIVLISAPDKLWQGELVRSKFKVLCREEKLTKIKGAEINGDVLIQYAKESKGLKKK